jgi:hypothetical protein
MTRKYKPPVAPTSQTSHQKPVIKEQLKRMIAGAALSIIKPTTIHALFKFKNYSQPAALNLTWLIQNYLRRHVLNGVKRVSEYFN